MLPNKTSLNILILVFVCLALFLPGSLKRGLWSPDETRYITVSKEMVDSGDWITLRRNGEIYTQKPPVFFWAISAFGLLMGGFSELSARFVSILSGTGTVIATYIFTRKLFNDNTALISGLILSTAIAFFAASQLVMLDPLFTFLTVSSLYLIYTGLTDASRRSLCYFTAFILMALATLTKGPVGFIIPLLATAVYALFTRQARALLSRGTIAGFAVFLVIIASWLIPACIKGGEAYTNELLIKQIFGRYLQAFDHKEPLYYYFYAFPGGFLPWIIFLPAAAFLLIKNWTDDRAKLLVCWALSIFIFFTTSKSKNILYILPMYPAAAIAIAYYWDHGRKPVKPLLISVAAIIALSASISLFVMPHIDRLKSPKYLSSEISGIIGPSDTLSTFRINPVYWIYYCGRGHINELDGNDKLNEYLLSKERVFCIIDLSAYRDYIGSNKNHGYLLAYMPYGSRKTFGLISNRIR
jgi:4-amino-4-deoxy-L-arabinose transferase-like glycosyltransferase